MNSAHLRGTAAFLLAGLSSNVGAHAGHGTDSLFHSLLQAVSLDQLLAIAAVGVLSALAGASWLLRRR